MLAEDSAPSRKHRSTSRPPLVGRKEELELLIGQLGKAMVREGSTVIISGEAGIGKTRLTEEVIALARSSDCEVLHGRCVPGAPFPFLPFREAFADHDRSTRGIADRGARTSGTGTHASIFSTSSATGVLDATKAQENQAVLLSTFDLLQDLSATRTLLLVLEDIHWADTASIQLLHFLTRTAGRLRLMVLANYRSEELVDSSGGPTPLLNALRLMRHESGSIQIDLKPLDTIETRQALEGFAMQPVESIILDKLASDSGGNPLYALESIRELIESERIELINGIWKTKANMELGTPTAMREVILRRLERIPAGQRRLLECAAVVGVRFEPEVVADTLSMKPLEVLEELEAMEHKNMLLYEDGEKYRFAHEKIRAVAYEKISNARRRELHRKVGTWIENKQGGEQAYGELSLHYFHAGMEEKCIDYSLLAGECCVNRFSGAEAIPYFERALELVGTEQEQRNVWLRGIEGLGDSYLTILNWQKAYDRFHEALEKVTDGDHKARLYRKCMECWDPARLGQGTFERAVELITKADQCKIADPRERAEVVSGMAYIALWQGEFGRAATLFDRAIGDFDRIGDHGRLAWELTSSAVVDISRMRLDEALARLEKAAAIFTDHPWPWGQQENDQIRCRVLICKGQYDEALALADRALEVTYKLGFDREGCWGHFLKALIYDLKGNIPAAMAEGEKSLEEAVKYGSKFLEALPVSLLVHFYSRTGHTEKAQVMVLSAKEQLTAIGKGIKSPVEGLIVAAEAEVQAFTNEWPLSQSSFERSLSSFEGVQYGALYRAVVLQWYGDSLAHRSDLQGAASCWEKARSIFHEMGNEVQAVTLATRISKLGPSEATPR